MPIPVTESIGKARWKQGEDDDLSIEIQIPIVFPTGVRPKELSVEIKDDTVLCIGHGNTRILQWRLLNAVNKDVEWRVEEESTIIVDLEKKSQSPWSCLLDLPMRADDELFTPLDEIDRMFTDQLPPLPPLEKSSGTPSNEADTGAADDLDRLLEEAAAEATNEQEKGVDTEEGFAAFVKAELANFEQEEALMSTKLSEINAQLASAVEGASPKDALSQKATLEEMLRLHKEIRELSSRPSSLKNFLECTKLRLHKDRVNIGQAGLLEEEEYADEEERSLSATELMTSGLKHLQGEDIKGCLHYLRLAAIHHKHDESILLLYNICSELSSPRGAYILLLRALEDDNLSAMVNQKVGELFDTGARHFLPVFPAALFFYERAARLGNVNAMLSLSQMWLRGSTSSSLLSESQMEAQKSMSKYHAWLEKATDRGCGAAYFVKGCMFLKGEHGVKKSYASAKECLDAAQDIQPEIIRRAPVVSMMLETLRKEEERSGGNSDGGNTLITKQAGSPDGTVQVTSSAARLNALGAPKGRVADNQPVNRAKKGLNSSSKGKAFWQRACVTGITAYGVYTLAFPIRVMLLPFFYNLLGSVVEAIPWLANPNIGAELQA